MSKQGIQVSAEILFQMQEGRRKLLVCATQSGDANTPDAKQDILLSNMFEKAKDAIKDDFAKITMGQYPFGCKKIT